MSEIKITLPDGSVREYPSGITAHQVAQSISEGLARNIIAAKVNGQVVETSRPITTDANLTLLKWEDKEGKNTFWHSSAHLLAEALEALYPGVKFGIGPAIDSGFYYDIDLGDHKFSGEDFAKLEAKMLELAKKESVYIRKEVGKAEAIQYFTEKGDEYKVELLQDLNDGEITLNSIFLNCRALVNIFPIAPFPSTNT